MRDLPTGTVTFLFTDIEGSTRLLHELGDAYAEALTKHRQVLREAFAAHGDVEVDTQGDAFFYAFPTAPGALAAAREGQEALAQGPIRVRMGLHTGKAQRTEEGYVRIEVHKGARIASAAHGGQVVLSGETRAQLVEVLALSDLGEHRVKDFAEPVWIYQLGDERFPPLKTISNTNLPRPVSSFVGREREVSEVVSLLQDGARLVTLSGPGGSGKTRLAIEAASELVPEFQNGVFWFRRPGAGRLTDAAALFRESLSIRVEFTRSGADDAVEGLAAIATARGDPSTTARLLGATEGWRRKSTTCKRPPNRRFATAPSRLPGRRWARTPTRSWHGKERRSTSTRRSRSHSQP
jgi:hypothetical protein